MRTNFRNFLNRYNKVSEFNTNETGYFNYEMHCRVCINSLNKLYQPSSAMVAENLPEQ